MVRVREAAVDAPLNEMEKEPPEKSVGRFNEGRRTFSMDEKRC
jgi:hypothetical protein